MNVQTKTPVKVITPNDGYNYFFGYYDLQPYSVDLTKHLTHRVTFNDRLPTADDVAELGYIDLATTTFHKVAETRAWNFQQGAMLQWFDNDSIIFNDFRQGAYCSVIKNIHTQEERTLCMPLAHLSADRKWGLSINFCRVYNFRLGYGYSNIVDPYFNELAPEQDGVFLVDVTNNTQKLILNYKQLKELYPAPPYTDLKLVINHITFNPSATKFLFLLRNFPAREQGIGWHTILLTCDRDGGNLHNLTNYEMNSHYHWKNDDEIMIYSGLPERKIYFFNDKTSEKTWIDDELINKGDIHCFYSPDRTCFIGDGYPDDDNFRHLFLYDFETQKSCEILKIWSYPVKIGDFRCDLHNRFTPDGKKVSFDSFHNELRSICQFDFDKEQLLK